MHADVSGPAVRLDPWLGNQIGVGPSISAILLDASELILKRRRREIARRWRFGVPSSAASRLHPGSVVERCIQLAASLWRHGAWGQTFDLRFSFAPPFCIVDQSR